MPARQHPIPFEALLLVRFLQALVPAVREAWAEANGRICSRACSEMHTWDERCICTTGPPR